MSDPRIAATYINGKLAPWCYPTDPRHPIYWKEIDMPLPEGLDHNVNRNSFTKEDAAKIFAEAAKQVQSSETAGKLINQLMDVGFVLLKAIAGASA